MGCHCSGAKNLDRNENVTVNINDNNCSNENIIKNDITKCQNITKFTVNSNNNSISLVKDNNSISNNKGRKKKYDYTKYPNEALRLINIIRNNPPSFIPDIQQSISKIRLEQNRYIYAGDLKVFLNEGEKIFKEAIEYLQNLKPMKDLVMDENIIIQCPNDEEKLKNVKYFLAKIIEKNKEYTLETYFKEAVIDPYISILLSIVDDNGKNTGRKRQALLNEEYTKIGISANKIGKVFCAYYTFSK